jgi:hypothetical protein
MNMNIGSWKRSAAALAILLSLSFSSALAQADEPPASHVKDKSGADVALPVRLASFTFCAVAGAPIAIARRMYAQSVSGTRDLVGESKNPLLLLPAVSLSVPFGVMGGFFEGIGYSMANSWRGSGDEPFGKEAFSLGDSD